MQIFTIGFAGKTAEEFFETLKVNGIHRLLDVRLQTTSQLAGYARTPNLAYFLRELCGISYHHLTQLAPTREILDAYKKKKGSWEDYVQAYLELLRQRGVEGKLEEELFAGPSVLLCSETLPQHCHRRLALDYLSEKWPHLELEQVHL